MSSKGRDEEALQAVALMKAVLFPPAGIMRCVDANAAAVTVAYYI